MIQCKTMGRLGNWCFQLSATLAHARRLNTQYRMPLRSQNEQLWPTPKFTKVAYGGPLPGKLYNEPAHHYIPIPVEDGLILNGYWQSQKYFAGYEAEIADLLEFPAPKLNQVAVHVRRGDYLQFPDQFPVLPNDYYLTAIDLMKSIGRTNFVFYSDDLNWCRQTFGNTFSYSNKTPLVEMREIYNSTDAIISNSSFSLFPCLLDGGKNVIAPKGEMWYGVKNKHLSTHDLMNEKWAKI